MTLTGKLVFAIAAFALAIGMLAMLHGAPRIVPVPALTPAQMVERPSQASADDDLDDELYAAPPDPGDS